MTNSQIVQHFFFQIALILLACRLVGMIAKRCGQPQVVAEMIAGILLGPSFFGFFAPELQEWIFPWDVTEKTRDSQSYLYPISQLGLALYMFMVGLEFNEEVFKKQFKSSVAISIAGMIFPFILGVGLGWIFHQYTSLFTSDTSLLSATLFLGASMCVTAFPVLARIIYFKKITNTLIGVIALGGAAIDDISAWCLLAFVLSTISGSFIDLIITLGGVIVYVAIILLFIRPLLNKFQTLWIHKDSSTEVGLIICLVLMISGSLYTDHINLHVVFGAFVMGVAIPRGVLANDIMKRLQPLTISLLLPLFFTYSGLHTKIALLNTPFLWMMCLAVIGAAIIGKVAACSLAAIATGIHYREALGIGILMNTRGLMELIIINIGLQKGIISESLFSILVIMAVVTTLMTSPLLTYVVKVPSITFHGGRSQK